MSDDSTNISALLVCWFEQGDERALRCAYQELANRLIVTPEAVKVLGPAAADEVRQDVLSRLLDRTNGKLRTAQFPIAYAISAWRRVLVSSIRKWGPRSSKEDDVRLHISSLMERDDHAAVEVRLDAARAISIAADLSGSGRLAILLTSRPDRITDADWRDLIRSLPPPPPPKPRVALDREEASLLLYPPQGPEDAKQHNQRLNSFDKAFKRAVTRIREIMEVEP
jgi:hypothetical protein